MKKQFHEIRDPIHVFVRLDSDERRVVDTPPLQRLRHVHQLGLSFLVYPGATHRRFEHSLGVVELAGRVFDVVTRRENVTDQIKDSLPEIADEGKLSYWRRALRMAALCHDIGHLPFSHAAEKELLPRGYTHEFISAAIIRSPQMKRLWKTMRLQAEDIVKLALGPKEAPKQRFSRWETILADIIVGDAFGVDRMDYLLRDSHHAGVAYGRFDHYRLIDTLRILPSPPTDKSGDFAEPALGVEEGGIHSAEALMLARYFMYSQVYFHPIRRIYDIHLRDFLKDWLKGGVFSTDVADHLSLTDNEVTAGFLKTACDGKSRGHDPARRIVRREHFRVLYDRHPEDVKVNPESGKAVFDAIKRQFGPARFRWDRYTQKGGAPDFPVRTRDGRIESSIAFSEVLSKLPILSVDFVFAEPEILAKASRWLDANRSKVIQPRKEK